jgi:UDPglucose 6-dehydrogenase
VRAFDPTVPRHRLGVPDDITLCADGYEAAEGADALAVLTEWDDFRWLDPLQVASRMKGRQVVDGRNILDRSEWQRAGFGHQGIGR